MPRRQLASKRAEPQQARRVEADSASARTDSLPRRARGPKHRRDESRTEVRPSQGSQLREARVAAHCLRVHSATHHPRVEAGPLPDPERRAGSNQEPPLVRA